MPVYVRDVLEADPTATVYILAPGGIGFLVGTALGPWLMDRRGERALGVIALMLLSLGFILWGDRWRPSWRRSAHRLLAVRHIAQSRDRGSRIDLDPDRDRLDVGRRRGPDVNRYIILARQASTFGMQEVSTMR